AGATQRRRSDEEPGTPVPGVGGGAGGGGPACGVGRRCGRRLGGRVVRGRGVWEDVEDIAPAEHVGRRTCPPPGDEHALLDLAVALVAEPLPRDRALW